MRSIHNYFKLIRVKQWIKNLLVLAPLVFSNNLFDPGKVTLGLLAFLNFCLISSIVYVINDLNDIASDRVHPIKSKRPLASGLIRTLHAKILLLILFIGSVVLAAYIQNLQLTLILLSYFVLNIAYAYYLKHISIIDCFSIALGFELRILAGCMAIGVSPSDFILLVTFFLALTLAFIKRKGELKVMQADSGKHRKSLTEYTPALLDKLILLCSAITLIGYLFYTIDTHTVHIFGNNYLKYSIPFVCFGLFRFIQLTEINTYEGEGDPSTLIYRDRKLQLSLAGWFIYIALCIYVF